MKKTCILSISVLAVLLVLFSPLANTASAINSPVVIAKPNPGVAYGTITIEIIASTEQAITDWANCELVVFFGDDNSQKIGKMEEQQDNTLTKSTTHKYSKSGQYTIEVVPVNCKLSKSKMLKTTVQILPPKPRIVPKPRGK